MSEQELLTVVARIRGQEERVSSFYTMGKLAIRDWRGESESQMLIVGTKSPFRIKIEITHSWGQPILHILIDQSTLQVLSFPDKRLYIGTFSPESLSKFFPAELEFELVWAVLRGYVTLLKPHRFASARAHQVTVYDKGEKKVEVIELDPESGHPKIVSLPLKRIKVAFSGYKEMEGIFYAGEVDVTQTMGSKGMTLRNKKMVFNRMIPEEIFVLRSPPAFEVYNLDKIKP